MQRVNLPATALLKTVHERAIRLAQMIWDLNAWNTVPFGPELPSAIEQWIVPVKVIDWWTLPLDQRDVTFLGGSSINDFDANTLANYDQAITHNIVIYNGRRYERRIWWSLAHEFGHIVLGHALVGRHQNRLLEREANVFAAELLMPMGAVAHLVGWTPAELAKIFGTSVEAALYRLKDLEMGWARLYTAKELENGRMRIDQLPRWCENTGCPDGYIRLSQAHCTTCGLPTVLAR